MRLLSLLTANGRATARTEKLFHGKSDVAVNVATAMICSAGIRAIYLNKKKIKAIHPTTIFGLYYTPEDLLKKFKEGTALIMSEDSPERARYAPLLKRSKIDNWLWNNDEKIPYEWDSYMTLLLDTVDEFLSLLRDAYEIEGRHVAGFRLEQMYYPLCDIISIAEAFFNKTALK